MTTIDGRELTVRCRTDVVKANKVDLEETRKQGIVDCRQTLLRGDCRRTVPPLDCRRTVESGDCRRTVVPLDRRRSMESGDCRWTVVPLDCRRTVLPVDLLSDYAGP